ncbi:MULTISPECIES: CHAP domain-containing protein [unclassified Sphingomonas]|uniref:CHAP domain-containing protein n=1 Tax=unclassified Sphingomonas TaxID=196159 RepID=UPI000E711F9F|nr:MULTISPECIES: CHAP domain-containing protein [unclassified Sphingomonas]RKE53824.1 CHAP domain-containing protein [Sphingomonas sp. PP-CC-1A-547]TCM10320.1 CHAP domain-containing protein [Sphingomonas sp. PP-CC-3G-468]
MNFKALAARFALVVSCGLMTATPAAAQFWQCVTFARSVSGIEIRGNANTWWSQAEGRYERGHTPKAGSVLAFAATSRMRVGHVAMVSQVINDHEVLLTHANWSRPGAIETNVRAIDVSPAGDWSMVKVWYGPQGGLGTSAYPTKGFIYSGHAPKDRLDAAEQSSFQMASTTHTVTATQRANAAQLATIQHGPTDPRGIFTLVNEAN